MTRKLLLGIVIVAVILAGSATVSRGDLLIKLDAASKETQLQNTCVKESGAQFIPVSTFARLEKHATTRALNRFQQLNSVKFSGMSIGTFFTLLVVPSICILIAKDHGAETPKNLGEMELSHE